MGYIFISYSHQDNGQVLLALDTMRQHKYQIWYDEKDIQAATQWTDTLADSITNCAVFMPFVSDSYGVSEQCMREIRHAVRKNKPIVPVFLTDKHTLPEKLNYKLEDWQGFTLQNATPDAFAAWLDKQTVFQTCREAADSVSNLVLVTERPMSPTPYFVGRDDILDAIEAAFRDGDDIVNVYGMGGIGKSEICRKFFRDRAPGLVTRAGWLTWRDTLQNTLYAQFPDIREDNAARYAQLARNYVNDAGHDLLLVVDNADTLTPDDVRELSQLQCRLLVTSRRRQGRFQHIPAATLPPEQCRILYRRALLRDDTISDASPDDDALTEILRLAAWHTLTVELLAKTQRAAGLDTAELLRELRDTGFDLSGEDIEYLHNPETASKDIDPECPFIEHMSRIFDLSQLRDAKRGAEALRALQGMSLLSPNTLIPVKTVKAWLDLPNLNGVNKAADLGWLNKEQQPDKVWYVSIHPVIAAVVWHTEPPEADYVDAIAGRLYKAMCYEPTEVFVTRLPILEHAIALHRVAKSMDLQMENYGGMLHQIGYLVDEQGNYASALEWYQKARRMRERVLGTDHPDTATTYNNIAAVYYAQGNYASALERFQKALRISERVLGTDHPDTANIYGGIALVYYAQGDYASALECYQKALRIVEGVLGTDHLDTAATYTGIALVYDAQGDYASALEWFQKALTIFERVLGTDHPSTATTYHNIGTNYFKQGDFREALQWLEKALAIRLRVLGEKHPLTKSTQDWIDAAQRALSGESENAP